MTFGQTPEKLLHARDSFIAVYQLYHDEFSRCYVDPGFNALLVTQDDLKSTYSVMSELMRLGTHRQTDYFGILPWNFTFKINLDASTLIEKIELAEFSADVFSFFYGRPKKIWKVNNPLQGHFMELGDTLLKLIGVSANLDQLEGVIVPDHYFICRSGLYERYWTEFLGPALGMLLDSSQTKLQALLHRNASFTVQSSEDNDTNSDGERPSLPIHEFVLERLFSTWLALNPDLKVTPVTGIIPFLWGL